MTRAEERRPAGHGTPSDTTTPLDPHDDRSLERSAQASPAMPAERTPHGWPTGPVWSPTRPATGPAWSLTGPTVDADRSVTGRPTDVPGPIAVTLTVPDVHGLDMLGAALAYAAAGWYLVPVRRGTKHPGSVLLGGWHEQSSRDPRQIAAWFAGTDHGIALHAGRSGVVVFDVDTPDRLPPVLGDALARGGPPWQATRAGVTNRGHAVFAQPPGRRLGNTTGLLGGGWGEVRGQNGVIVVEPTEHPDGGLYHWLRVGPVPVLPTSLAELLPDAEQPGARLTGTEVAQLAAGWSPGPSCRPVAALLDRSREQLDGVAAGGGRHDVARDRCWELVRLAHEGHAGVADALDELHDAFVAVKPEGAGREWRGLFDGAVAKLPGRPVAGDPCTSALATFVEDAGRGHTAAGTAGPTGHATAGATGPTDGHDRSVPTATPWTVLDALGHDDFDPAGDDSDQGLADAAALRLLPVLRYAGDAGAWVRRERRDVWTEVRDDGAITGWALSLLARVMPLGQTPVPKEADKRSPAHWQAARRALFRSSAGAGRVGTKLRAVVHAGHAATVQSADLDAEPGVLWAGGVPWDLRRSGDVPTPAPIDPGAPHLRTALCAPDPTVATPRWDRFLAAVWPDPELRAWALRVLSIGLTGEADAALPVLYGPARSGKTSAVQMLVQLLGSYATAANPKLLSGGEGAHDSIVYELKGRRLAFIDEGPRRSHLAVERLKQLTGGGPLTASAKYQAPVTFSPTHTLVMTTNDEPSLVDPALRARVRLIPCDADEQVVRPARLALLGNGLREEAPGVLAALMREAADYLAAPDSSLTAAAPAYVRGLAQEVADAQDPVREWVETCTTPDATGTSGRELHTVFARWYRDHPLHGRTTPPSETAFGRSLTALGFPAVRDAQARRRGLTARVVTTPSGFMNGGWS